MGANSKIEWCHHTCNLWWGCHKVHTGCKNCYAEYYSDVRYQKSLWGDKADRQMINVAFKNLAKWQKAAEANDIRFRVFVGSMMDIFENSHNLNNPNEKFTNTADLRKELFGRIWFGDYENLDFLFLTKRPDNIDLLLNWPRADLQPKNVWFGTSVSDQETADKYIDLLRKQDVRNRFISLEPQVGEITKMDLSGIHWLIQGMESGHKKRPYEVKWGYQVRDLCREQQVPFFFKQLDKVAPIPPDLMIREFPMALDYE